MDMRMEFEMSGAYICRSGSMNLIRREPEKCKLGLVELQET
jgi:hypothetical protein